MGETLNILNNYSREAHNNTLYNNINPIPFSINSIKSSLWSIEENIPYVATSHLLDSYSCLPQRPDMAFTFLWKSINNCYKKISTNKILNSGITNVRLTDSQGIDNLIEEIDNIKSNNISSTYTIINLINEYSGLITTKPCKFLSNQILKGYVMKEAGIPNFMIGGTYSSFKTANVDLHNKIVSTYGQAYKTISNPTLIHNKVDLGITDLQKGKTIPESLANKIKELIVNRYSTIQNSGRTTSFNLRITSDKQLLELLIKTILYSIRNNSVHGNLASRLNSDYVNSDSLKTAIYIYFLGHFILSLAMYINQEIELTDLKVNIENLELLKTLL